MQKRKKLWHISYPLSDLVHTFPLVQCHLISTNLHACLFKHYPITSDYYKRMADAVAFRVGLAKATIKLEVARPGIKRLALIISDDYTSLPQCQRLPGTNRDNEAMADAFALQDNFAVVRIQNGAIKEVMEEIIPFVVNFVSAKEYFDCLAIVFAGHGGEGQTILSCTGEPVNFEEAFVKPLHLLRSDVFKLVFIDACRGSIELRDKGKLPGARCNLDNIELPTRTLLAYSTMPHHCAYEDRYKGSAWMQALAQHLQRRESIVNIVTRANQAVANQEGRWQRPEYKTSDCNFRLKGKYFKSTVAAWCMAPLLKRMPIVAGKE
jgi:hypothetical protein